MPSRSQANVTTDHDEIRSWAEERGAQPACVRGTGDEGDIGMLRLDFPGYSGADSLEHISWDDWFKKFDERGLALLHQDTTARGQKSNFNKIISRETAEERQEGDGHRARRSGSRGARSSAGSSRSSSRTSESAGSSRSGNSRSASSRDSQSRGKRASASNRNSQSSGKAEPASRSSRSNTSESSGGSSRRSGGAAHALTDHDEIRGWAEERNAAPACVRRTGGKGDIGVIRLDFPGYSGESSLEHIDWDEWFQKFDENGLALLVQDTTAGGEKSNFNKIVSRETAEKPSSGRGRRSSGRASRSNEGRSDSSRSTRSASSQSKRGQQARSSRAKKSSGSRGKTANINAPKKRAASADSRGSSRSTRTSSARGRQGSRSSNRRAA